MNTLKQGKLLGCAFAVLLVCGARGALPAKAERPSSVFPGWMASSTRAHVPPFERVDRSQGTHLFGKVIEVFPDHLSLEIANSAFFGQTAKKQATERVNVSMSGAKQERVFTKKMKKIAVGDLVMVQGDWNEGKTQFTAKRLMSLPADSTFRPLNTQKKSPVRPKKVVR